MMIKIVVVGMLAACAMAQFPMMGMGGFGGLDLKNIESMIPEGTFDMIKNMKPEDIKEAMKNMPPGMADMMKGMGISEDQIKDAIKNMPEDMDVAAMIDQAKDKMGDLVDQSKEEMKNQMSNELNQIKEEKRKELEEAGIDLSGGVTGLMSQMLPEITEMFGDKLKAEGIDTDDREKLNEELRRQMREFAGAEEDDTEEQVKEKFMKGFLEEMKQNGFEIKSDDTAEGFQELKTQIVAELKDMGFEIEDEDVSNLPEMLKKMMKSGKFNPQQLMGMVAPMMQGPPMMGPMGPMGPPMMRPPMMQGPPMEMRPGMNLNLDIDIHQRPQTPVVTPGYVQGAEDALLHAFGDDSDVVRHVMAVKFGAETGTVMEGDLHEILRDLMHYRLEARVLMAKNQMLRNRLYDVML
ncbi:uncharacterized protein LOC127712742 [Mytilus californianus]|uniref:uncharacterized protein LOC127712742 n=1 Tax=Mytilus californianus TaxID=6549 RepID=UPI002245128E|nr:uncharacterized protein LOC127712742 [Mytilus californianus]